MIIASCHCGAVQLTVTDESSELTECNCSICRRYGVLWAYYAPTEVEGPAPETTDTYMWDDRSIAFHRCRQCGCVSHWSPTDPTKERMGINARLMDPEAVSRAKVRHLDGAVTEQYVD
jgi:hypothetical protein